MLATSDSRMLILFADALIISIEVVLLFSNQIAILHFFISVLHLVQWGDNETLTVKRSCLITGRPSNGIELRVSWSHSCS